MARHTITIIPGDGVGPELSAAACRAIDATGVEISWEVHNAGLAVMEATGDPLPPAVVDSIRRNKVALKGPLTTPIGSGIRSVNVALRRELDLFALVRPLKSYPGVRSRFEDIDLVVVRENTEDLYAGIEFAVGEPETLELIADIERLNGRKIRSDAGISIKPISIFGTQRVFRFAFQWAIDNGRHMVTAVHKANIMKHTDGLWLRTAREVSTEFPQIEFNDRIVDNMAMQLVQKPEIYDVMVMPNLYGDILTDLGAGMIGGLGIAAGANFGDGVAMFEATHGSAPKYAGQNKANPMAMMFSGVLMLRYIGEKDAADRLERALAQVIAEGRSVTYDMKAERDDPSAVGTAEVADAVVEALGRSA
ncbi:MAG: isocitrate/isopropylmalate dehydrogenase family protein [Candidatus Dormiibacterota bacterium]